MGDKISREQCNDSNNNNQDGTVNAIDNNISNTNINDNTSESKHNGVEGDVNISKSPILTNNEHQKATVDIDKKIIRHQKCRSSGNIQEYSSDSSTKEQSDGSLSDHEHENNFSHPDDKRTLLNQPDDDDFDNDDDFPKTTITTTTTNQQPSSSPPNIDIDIKRVFGTMRPVHEDYSQEEIDKSCTTYSTIPNNNYELNFCRNGEQVRRTYIAKLITKKVWVPSQKEKTHNSLIIFDWDDTLLCTSFLTPNGVYDENMELSAADREKVKKLEFAALNLLKKAIEKGDVYIITNAGPGWVEYSAEKFYPSLKTVLNKITIISARGEYEAESPGDPRKWKKRTFLNLQKKMNTKLVTNIICLGDSTFEMEAGKVLAKKFQQAFVKTVKFRENPKPEELHSQLVLVANQFNSIYAAVKSLTIRVEKKKANANAKQQVTNNNNNNSNNE
jgi:FMN phosphatase YigB (HAD superfamily)